MASKIYTRTGDKGKTSLIGGTKVPKSHVRIDSYGTVDELNSFIGLLGDQLSIALASHPAPEANAPIGHAVPSVSSSDSNSPTGRSASSVLPSDSSSPTGRSASSISPSGSSSPAGSITLPRDAANAAATPRVAPQSGSSLFGAELVLLRGIQDRLFTIGASLACDPDKEPKLKIPDLKEEDIQRLEKEIDRMSEALPPMDSFLLPGGHLAVSTAHIARCVCRRAERICVDMQENGLFIEPIVIQYLNRLSDYLFMLARYAGHILQVPEIPWRPRV